MVEFWECIWYLKPNSVGRLKADTRWEEGCVLGIRDRSGEVLVGASEGVIKVRPVRRRGFEVTRWSEELMSIMKGTPW
jgi:hypothetical protein